MDYITLTEHQVEALKADSLTYQEAAIVRRRYGKHLSIEYPSPATDNYWIIRPKGKVGVLPLRPDRAIHIRPKGSVRNVFQMLDLIGELPEIPKGIATTEPVTDIIQQLIRMLSSQVQRRARRGLHQAYERQARRLPYIRGKVDVARHLRSAHQLQIPCRYLKRKADIEINRILAWTLYKVHRSGLCTAQTQKSVRMALKCLSGYVKITPMETQVCRRQTYDRLTQDYASLHGACYLLLKHMGLSHRSGEEHTIPFIVDMPDVFEKYVVELLRQTVNPDVRVVPQYQYPHAFGRFTMDAVLFSRRDDKADTVVEVKYKYTQNPSSDDVQQVVAYATALNCKHAVLVFPSVGICQKKARIGDVIVSLRTIPLDSDTLKSVHSSGILSELVLL